MKKLLRFLLLFLLCGLLIGLAGYLGLSMYYRNNFSVNTWINGVYCTGKSLEQVNKELVSAEKAAAELYLVAPDSSRWEIDILEAGIQLDYTAELKKYLQGNDAFYWMDHLRKNTSVELTPKWTVADEEKFRSYLEQIPFIAQELDKEYGVKLRLSEEGYSLWDGNCQRLNFDRTYDYLRECLANGQTTVSLGEGGCYEDIQDSSEDKRQRQLWRKICDYAEDCSWIVYDMGSEKIEFTPALVAGFLEKEEKGDVPALDEKGELIISEEKVYQWVDELALAYDTYGMEREFLSTRGDVVKVKYCTYGTRLNAQKEKEYLWKVLHEKPQEAEEGPHIPDYTREAYARGLDDLGGTFIEIDLTEQRMYYYEHHELILETDVVTGNLSWRLGTPEGIYYLYGKQRNRVLMGGDVPAFVKYWMPINGGIGIHDASWRSSFGGEIYKTNGSHGCINTPTDIVSQLYEMAEVGVPAVVFY